MRPHAAEAEKAHAAQPHSIQLPRELALDEVEIIADCRKISAGPVGLPQCERIGGTVGWIGHGAQLS
jgi:hypothetical protein